jgi:hypothetical protein
MEELISKYTPKNRKQLTLLCGDLNINLMNNTPEKSKLLDIIEIHGLVQVNLKLSRIFNNTIPLIDHIFVISLLRVP